MKKDPYFSIVIVNWNTEEYLKRCIQSIYSNIGKAEFEIIVVDNASTDNSLGMLKDNFPDVKVIKNGINVGFAKANNQGIRLSSGVFIFILNPDTVVIGDAIREMIRSAESDQSIGIVGPMVLKEDGKVLRYCIMPYPTLFEVFKEIFLINKFYDFLADRFPGSIGKLYHSRYSKSCPVECVSGSSMLLRRKMLDDIGVFDESVPMYLDDIDLCYRAKSKYWKVFYDANARIKHLWKKSTLILPKPKRLDILALYARDVFFISLACFLVFFALSKYIIRMILGGGFTESIAIARILSPLLVIIPMSAIFANLTMIPFKMDKYFSRTYIAGAAINLVLLFLTVYVLNLGSTGAALSSLVTQLVLVCIMYMILAERGIKIIRFWGEGKP